MSALWKVIKLAAGAIPWGTVVENAPAVVDLVARAKDKFKGAGQDDVLERIAQLQEENQHVRLLLQQTGEHLQIVESRLLMLEARQRLLSVVAVLSLLAAVAALVVTFSR